jgi:hypothetical protein
MSGWSLSPALLLCRVSWRCSESGGEGCDRGWRLAPALPVRVPPADKARFRPRMVVDLLLPRDCPALVKPAALCQNASWTSYPSLETKRPRNTACLALDTIDDLASCVREAVEYVRSEALPPDQSADHPAR